VVWDMRVFVDGRSVGSTGGRLTPNTLGPEDLVEIKGDRHTISVNTAGCWPGVGTIFVDDLSGLIDVVRDGNKNEDELFRQICDAANVKVRQR